MKGLKKCEVEGFVATLTLAGTKIYTCALTTKYNFDSNSITESREFDFSTWRSTQVKMSFIVNFLQLQRLLNLLSQFMFALVTAEANSIITVTIMTPNVTYDVGQKVVLNCKVWTTSEPTFVQWTRRDGETVTVLENKTIIRPATNNSRHHFSLLHHTINKVSFDHTGTYVCQAEILNSSHFAKDFYHLAVRGNFLTLLKLLLPLFIVIITIIISYFFNSIYVILDKGEE